MGIAGLTALNCVRDAGARHRRGSGRRPGRVGRRRQHDRVAGSLRRRHRLGPDRLRGQGGGDHGGGRRPRPRRRTRRTSPPTLADLEPTVAFDVLGDGYVAALVEAMAQPRSDRLARCLGGLRGHVQHAPAVPQDAVAARLRRDDPHPRGAPPRAPGRAGGGPRRGELRCASTRSSRSRTSTRPSSVSWTAASRASSCSTSAERGQAAAPPAPSPSGSPRPPPRPAAGWRAAPAAGRSG